MITAPQRLARQNSGMGSEMFHQLRDTVASEIRCCSPGIIQSWNQTDQTVTVLVAIRERVVQDGRVSHEEVPVLVDVHLCMYRCGGYALTFPVTAGDECLLFFSDRCYDSWWQSGGVQNQMDRRYHDLSDAFCVPIAWSQPRKITGYSSNSVQLRNEAGTGKVEVAGAVVNVVGTTVNVTGSSQVNISGATNTVIEGRNFLNHTHKNVQTGGGSTGGVN